MVAERKVPAGLHQARRAYNEAGRAYDEAGRALDEAGRAYDEAGRAHDEAWHAYGKAQRAPDCLEIALNLVPDAPWANGTLVFPKS